MSKVLALFAAGTVGLVWLCCVAEERRWWGNPARTCAAREGKGKAFVGERWLGGWVCGWGSSCRRLQYSYSKSNFARRAVVVLTLSAACMRNH